ncbi:MAG: glycosyltransferase [Chrysiogenetes bacterium]|nr:glycosyltransferase [Chrysiogenetes bacterium]
MKPLIVQVVSSLQVGGAERVALELAARLPRERYRSELLCAGPEDSGRNLFENPLEAEAARRSVPVRRIALPGIRDATARGEVQAYLREHEVRLVHVHNRPTDWQVVALARLVGVRGLYTRHLPYRDVSRRQRMAYVAAARLAKAVVAVSEPVRTHLLREELTPASKIRVIPNGIDLGKFTLKNDEERTRIRGKLGISENAFVWICAARLAEQKGHKYLLDAFAQLAEDSARTLLLAGDGPLEGALEAQAEKLGISAQVHFLGARTDVPALLGAADAYVCSSHSEGHPLSVLEALAMNLPVVAPRLSPITAVGADAFIEYFGPEQKGWAARHDPAELAQAMATVERRKTYAENARAFVESRYGIERMIDAHTQLYAEILGR